MELTISHEQGRVPITVFEVQGLINLGSAKILEENAQQEYQAGMRYLLIDLSEVSSLTSAGLRTIHMINNLLAGRTDVEDQTAEEQVKTDTKQKSPHLKLLNPQPDIRRVLNISGFDAYIQVLDDRQAAIDSF
jgi:anti-anti-sigma regulatory factor